MRDMGVEAIRTELVEDVRILAWADELGLQVFQELPLRWLSASGLQDTLSFAKRLLEEAVMRSEPYASARFFGLAQTSDTSSPEACTYFEELMPLVSRLSGARAFYSTTFAVDDRCADAVDFVLVRTLGMKDPEAALRLWPHSVPIGLESLGLEVRSRSYGLLQPYSAESQARYIEAHLPPLLESNALAVFVFRWRDDQTNAFGLITENGIHRSAYAVIEGIYSGTQQVFAFAQGNPPYTSFSWRVFLGWVVLFSLGILYHTSLRFRYTIRRYFLAHGYYVESVRNGREVLVLSTNILWMIQMLCSCLLFSLLLQAVQEHVALVYARTILFERGGALGAMLSHPAGLLGGLLALFCALFLIMWVLVSVTQRGLPTKLYMITIWPFWGTIPLGLASLTTLTMPPDQASTAVLTLAGLWIVFVAVAVVRVFLDLYLLLSRQAFLSTLRFCGVLVVFVLVGLFLAMTWAPDFFDVLAFFWHLVTRS